MNWPSGSGAATQVCSKRFDKRFHALPAELRQQIQDRLDDLGRRLASYPHQRLQGCDAFRLRVGDYRVIYRFDLERNVLLLGAVGHRRDIYHDLEFN